MKMPLMTNRDLVLEGSLKKESDGSMMFISQSIPHSKYPETKDPIRMDMLKLSHFKQEGDKVVGIEFSNMDMKGYFPTKMLNMVMGSMAGKGISEFAKRVKLESKD